MGLKCTEVATDPTAKADYSQASFALAAGEGLRGNRMQAYDLGFRVLPRACRG